jgi:hypothetical protein
MNYRKRVFCEIFCEMCLINLQPARPLRRPHRTPRGQVHCPRRQRPRRGPRGRRPPCRHYLRRALHRVYNGTPPRAPRHRPGAPRRASPLLILSESFLCIHIENLPLISAARRAQVLTVLYLSFREEWVRLFTNEAAVVDLTVSVIPIQACAAPAPPLLLFRSTASASCRGQHAHLSHALNRTPDYCSLFHALHRVRQ